MGEAVVGEGVGEADGVAVDVGVLPVKDGVRVNVAVSVGV